MQNQLTTTMDDNHGIEIPNGHGDDGTSSPLTILEHSPAICDNASIDLLSQSMRVMVKKIQDLRHLGVESKTLPLPKICVVGDQSAGKSSLIEGMSEIKVPRSAGCCTRCPLEINLTESDPGASWTCRVLLMKKYMYDAAGTKGKFVTRARPLGPWVEQDPEEFLFDTLTDKSRLQGVLKWAQLATLNPGRPPKDFTPGENTETDPFYAQVKFSPNVVRLDISAPGFPNLSFYDLPGIINVAEIDDEKYLVTLVENLVKEYIRADSCIVLLTMPMTDDATNSSAARIIREVPGARERTMGVLTKPDRIQYEEGYDQWREILRGSKFAIGHEYYVVKNNPSPLIDHAQAREEELHFFSRQPWTTELAEFKERFGTRNLQGALSKLLLSQIESSLPSIVEQINIQLGKVEEELATLPDPPTANIPFILCDKLHVYSTRVKAHIDGGLREYPFLKRWSQIASDFQKYITDSRPTLKLREENPVWRNAIFPAGSDPDCEITLCQTSPSKRKRIVTPNGDSDVKRPKVMPSPVPVTRPPVTSGDKNVFATETFSAYKVPARTFYLEEIREINQDTYRSGVPGLGNPQAVEMLNQMSVVHWKEPMEKFLNVIYSEIYQVLMDELDKSFIEWNQTRLYSELQSAIHEFLESIRLDHLQHSLENYNVECLKPFTLATTTFQRVQKEALDFLLARRHEVRTRMYIEAIEQLAENNGRQINSSKVTEADMGPDEFRKEIEIMAVTEALAPSHDRDLLTRKFEAVRAYYDIASSRFVDTTCQSVHTKLFFKCRNDLKEFIQDRLGIMSENASERCQELIAEDNEREVRRKFLKKEREKLQKAQASLRQANGFSNELFVPAV
ncbi:hypothetical protein VTO42DRAFT_8250 [Malbranchea cinnamomea]